MWQGQSCENDDWNILTAMTFQQVQCVKHTHTSSIAEPAFHNTEKCCKWRFDTRNLAAHSFRLNAHYTVSLTPAQTCWHYCWQHHCWPLNCSCVFVCDHLAGVKLLLNAVLHGQVLHSPSRPLQADLRSLQTHLQLHGPLTADMEEPVTRRPSTRVPSFTCDLDNHTEKISRRTKSQRLYVAEEGRVVETCM